MSASTPPVVLVTGANGTVGRATVAALIEQGLTVRAGVRDLAKGASLAALGATPVQLDLDAPDTLAAAFAGVDRLFLLTPFTEDPRPHVARALDAAKAAGVGFVLRMSALGAAEDAPFALSRMHAANEQQVRNSGLAWAVIQPSFFMDNPVKYQGAAIAHTGAFYGASDGAAAWISSLDIGAAAAAILAQPEAHGGQTYLLTGDEVLTEAQLAAQLAEAAGRPVAYVNVGPAALRASLDDQGTPGWQAQALLDLETVKANGWAAQTSDVVQRLTGRAPLSYREHLARTAHTLAVLNG